MCLWWFLHWSRITMRLLWFVLINLFWYRQIFIIFNFVVTEPYFLKITFSRKSTLNYFEQMTIKQTGTSDLECDDFCLWESLWCYNHNLFDSYNYLSILQTLYYLPMMHFNSRIIRYMNDDISWLSLPLRQNLLWKMKMFFSFVSMSYFSCYLCEKKYNPKDTYPGPYQWNHSFVVELACLPYAIELVTYFQFILC